MSTNAIAYAILVLVALQRLGELLLSQRNTRALLAQGGIELGAGHYPLIVLLHLAWLAAIAWFLPTPAPIQWPLLAVFILLQGLRLWVLASLGPYWTTRIITLPGAPLVTGGPYRFVRHPNYLVVAAEIAVLPLVFGETGVAVSFTLANAAMLAWRIRAEEAGLAARRTP
ncbi:MAG TPA: isoprenylcysteine carboxylmethyltransferase family protein [Rhizomicrobium sp.]|nr:isoprenylcysteine carboxylmethyltransferase family protein [Rhizomicrobium sp.]